MLLLVIANCLNDSNNIAFLQVMRIILISYLKSTGPLGERRYCVIETLQSRSVLVSFRRSSKLPVKFGSLQLQTGELKIC